MHSAYYSIMLSTCLHTLALQWPSLNSLIIGVQEKFINDPAVLLAAAVAAGLNNDAAAAFIADPEAGKAEVRFGLKSEGRLLAHVTNAIMTICHSPRVRGPLQCSICLDGKDEMYSKVTGS